MPSDTRDRLIRSTSRLLSRQGYGATGLNEVVAHAEAPKGSMYFHFPGGKAELAAAALGLFQERATIRMRRHLAEHASVSDAVVAIFDAYVAHLERTRYTEGCPVATVALDAAANNDLLAEATGRALREWVGIFATALEAEGRDAGDAHGLATLVVAAIEGTIVMAKGERSTEPVAATRDVLAGMLAAA